MAHQPTKSRKFLAGTVTAALVATAIVPTASAAEFSDIAGNTHEDAINALVDLGVINGYPDGTFQPNKTLSRSDVVKMMGKWLVTLGYEVPADYASVQRFDDVSLTGNQELLKYAALVKDTGVFNGSEGKLDPTGSITRENMALVLVRAFDEINGTDLVAHVEGEEFDQEVTDLSSAKAEARPFINVLDFYDITSVSEFMPKSTVTRGQFATFLYKTSKVEAPVDSVEVASVSAITAKSLKVTFAGPVDDTKAVFEVKKGSVKVNTSAITWNADKSEATIELAGKLTAGDYTVNVTGLTDEVLSETTTVQDEKVAKIEILSTEAPLVDSVDVDDALVDDLQVGYRVLNQYNEDITKTTSLTTSAANVSVNPSTGTVTIVGDYNTTTNKLATFTLIHASTATTTSATVTAVSESKVSDVTVKGIYNKDGKALTETSNLSSDLFYVELELKDQYGKVITNAAKMNEVLITESNSTVVDAAANATVIDVNGTKKVVVALTGTPQVGNNVVTAISLATGKSASYTVTVEESTRAYNVDVQAPELTVANEVTNIPVVVTDKAGNLITDLAVLKNAARGIKVTVGGSDQTANLIVKDGNVYLPQTLAEGFSSIVVISNATQKVDTLTLQVKAEAKPVIITGVTSTTFKANETKTFGVDKLVIEDQYGRVMTNAKVNAWLDAAATNKIVVTEDEVSTVVNIVDGATSEINTGTPADPVSVVAGAAKGTEKITVTLHNADGAIISSAKDATLRVTDGSEYVSYEVNAIGTVYDELAAGRLDSADYDKSVVVKGVLADGSKVTLSNVSDYAITSTNSTFNTDAADGTIDVTAAYTSYGDAAEISLPLSVTINATGEKLNQSVTVSRATAKVTDLNVVAQGEGADFIAGEDVAELTKFNFDAAANGAFSFADLDAQADVIATDQYGAAVVLTTAADTLSDGATLPVETLTFTKVAGNLVFSANGTTTAQVTELPLNSVFNVVLSSGSVNTEAVKVTATTAYNAALNAAVQAEADKIVPASFTALTDAQNALTIAQGLVAAGYTVTITSSANPGIATDGTITEAVAAQSGNVTFSVTKDGVTKNEVVATDVVAQ